MSEIIQIDIDRVEGDEDTVKELTCVVCFQLTLDPVECTQCQHLICQKCLISINQKCPFRCSNFKTQPVNRIIREQIKRLGIKCQNRVKGCKQLSFIENIQGHQETCKYNEKIECQQCKIKQHFIEVQRKQLEQYKNIINNQKKLLQNLSTISQDLNHINNSYSHEVHQFSQNLCVKESWQIFEKENKFDTAECLRDLSISSFVLTQKPLSFNTRIKFRINQLSDEDQNNGCLVIAIVNKERMIQNGYLQNGGKESYQIYSNGFLYFFNNENIEGDFQSDLMFNQNNTIELAFNQIEQCLEWSNSNDKHFNKKLNPPLQNLDDYHFAINAQIKGIQVQIIQ